MPDPQYYTTSNHPGTYDLYRKQSNWIRDTRAEHNTKHVLWLGDLTNDNTPSQWNVASAAYSILDNAGIPYAVVPGNHDYKTPTGWAGTHRRDLTWYNTVVGPQRFASKSWYGGNMGETTDFNENNYTYFSANGMDFLVVGLEYAPRKEAITWANKLISAHPNHRVILFTHAYLTTNGNYLGLSSASNYGAVGASGLELFEECASRHNNLFMVMCGHVNESHVNTKVGVNSNIVYEMLVDYQSENPKGAGSSLGNGWLRILKFDPVTNRIHGSTITPAAGDPSIFSGGITQFYHSNYPSDPLATDHHFTLAYNMATREPYSYLNASVRFHAMGVGQNLRADQVQPDMAQADNGDFVVVWQDDPEKNGIADILMRGFDADGNERFPVTRVSSALPDSINETNPAIAMAGDGRFAITWQTETTALKVRTFLPDGTPASAEQTVVSTVTPGSVIDPDIAMDGAGNFVVVWGDDSDGNGYFQVRGRGFYADGSQKFATRTINSISDGQQQKPAIAMSPDGRYVVTWKDDRSGTWDVEARGYGADDVQTIAQFKANTTLAGTQTNPDIAMDPDGRFVIVWEDDADLDGAHDIHARGFTATGAQAFAAMTVNKTTAQNQISPTVAMDARGYWYAAWQDYDKPATGYQIMSNAYTPSGTRLNSSETRINPATAVTYNFGPPVRKTPVISAHRSGRYIVTYADDMDGDGTSQVLARGIGNTALSLVVKSLYGTVTRSNDQPFYAPGDTVSLQANPKPGYTFMRWVGGVDGGIAVANPVSVTMNASKSITAEYLPTAGVADWGLY